MIILLFCIHVFSMIFSANGVELGQVCDCTNPVYIDQPTNIVQCKSKSKFYDQINANYKIVDGFIDQKSAKNCNYTTYRNIVNELKKATIHIVDSYFKCTERDCVKTITAAYKKYTDVAIKKFNPYLLCSYTYLSPECAVNIKHATYFSCENIMTVLLECAKFKSTSQQPDFRALQDLSLESCARKTPDCNCVKIDQRPIPYSKEECYSPKYFSTLIAFISDNFGRVKEVYRNASVAHPQCNYTDFIKRTLKTEEVTSQWPNILKKSSPTFKQLDLFSQDLLKLIIETNDAAREYILKEEKICYFTPRQLRQSALTISNYVIQILTKCVLYVDRTHSAC